MSEFNTTKISFNVKARKELVCQIEALQQFYFDMGYDSQNIRTIFSLILSYLRGRVNKLIIKTFFEVMMFENKLSSNKEINLLNCFDTLIEDLEEENKLDNLASMSKQEIKHSQAPSSNDVKIA